MIAIFRNNNPLAIGLLVLLALAPEFNTPQSSLDIDDKFSLFIWTLLNDFEAWLNFNESITGKIIRVAVNLFSALYINKMATDHKLMEKPGYLPALNYLLLQLLLPETNSLHIIFTQMVMIIILKLMIINYKNDRPVNNLITAGFLTGFITLIRSEAVICFIWLSIALLVMRPASLREWIVLLTGFLLPFYVLSCILYLTDKLEFQQVFTLQKFYFSLPAINSFDWIRICIIVITPLIFFIIASGQIAKLLIQGRKTFIITLLLCILIICLLLMDISSVVSNLSLYVLPASLLMSPLLVNTRKNMLPGLFILLLIVISQLR